MTCEHEHEQYQYIIIFLKYQEIGGWLMSILGIPRFVILDNVMIWAFPICGWFCARSARKKLCFTKTDKWIMCDCPGASTCIHSWLSFYLMCSSSVLKLLRSNPNFSDVLDVRIGTYKSFLSRLWYDYTKFRSNVAIQEIFCECICQSGGSSRKQCWQFSV